MGKLFDGLLQSLVLEFNVQPTKAVFTLRFDIYNAHTFCDV